MLLLTFEIHVFSYVVKRHIDIKLKDLYEETKMSLIMP